MNANLRSFANDTRISKSLNTTHSTHHLQTALGQMCVWAEDNNMIFNGEKLELLNFGKSDRSFHYTYQGKQIDDKEECKRSVNHF